MPNHVHLIVFIDGDKTPYKRRNISINRDSSPQYIENLAGWLSITVRCIKRAVTAYARKNGITFQWQTRFYDRIMRDMDETSKTIDYVMNYVAAWVTDRDNDIDVP